jgi:hypothetical protein
MQMDDWALQNLRSQNTAHQAAAELSRLGMAQTRQQMGFAADEAGRSGQRHKAFMWREGEYQRGEGDRFDAAESEARRAAAEAESAEVGARTQKHFEEQLGKTEASQDLTQTLGGFGQVMSILDAALLTGNMPPETEQQLKGAMRILSGSTAEIAQRLGSYYGVDPDAAPPAPVEDARGRTPGRVKYEALKGEQRAAEKAAVSHTKRVKQAEDWNKAHPETPKKAYNWLVFDEALGGLRQEGGDTPAALEAAKKRDDFERELRFEVVRPEWYGRLITDAELGDRKAQVYGYSRPGVAGGWSGF